MMKLLLPMLLLVACAGPARSATDYLDAFPPAESGMVRHVLALDPQPDESALKVEWIVGKTVDVDAVNSYFFSGAIEAGTVKGWGFTYYVVRDLGPMGGTLMAPDPQAPNIPRFIPLAGEPSLLRYNSRLPLVVYVPEDAEVRYRIWRADPELRPMEKR